MAQARCACGDDPRRFVTRVLMRCRECAAEVAVTARVCSRCGAPIVGQLPVVANTVVADTVVGAATNAAGSDAAGKAVPAVAGKALPEPFVPGSGDRVPAELRLVLAGYVGIAGGLFATALACAAAAVFFIFFADPVGDPDDDWNVGLSIVAVQLCVFGFVLAPIALQARIRFLSVLTRPLSAVSQRSTSSAACSGSRRDPEPATHAAGLRSLTIEFVFGQRCPRHVLPRRRSRSWLAQRLLDGFLGSDQRRGGGRVDVVR